jgi:hypothetical protein
VFASSLPVTSAESEFDDLPMELPPPAIAAAVESAPAPMEPPIREALNSPSVHESYALPKEPVQTQQPRVSVTIQPMQVELPAEPAIADAQSAASLVSEIADFAPSAPETAIKPVLELPEAVQPPAEVAPVVVSAIVPAIDPVIDPVVEPVVDPVVVPVVDPVVVPFIEPTQVSVAPQAEQQNELSNFTQTEESAPPSVEQEVESRNSPMI